MENALRDPLDHWLTGQPKTARQLLDFVIERAEERLKRRKDRDVPELPPPASFACRAS